MYEQQISDTKEFLKEYGHQFAKVVGTVLDGDDVIVVVDTSVVPGRRKLGHFVYDKEGTMLEYHLQP